MGPPDLCIEYPMRRLGHCHWHCVLEFYRYRNRDVYKVEDPIQIAKSPLPDPRYPLPTCELELFSGEGPYRNKRPTSV